MKDQDPGLRTDRRTVLRLLVLGTAGLACGRPETQGNPQVQPSQDQKPATPTLAREKTLDERAKEGTLNTWKELLSTTKTKDSTFMLTKTTKQLKMEISNPDTWSTVFQQALTGKSNVSLTVRWTFLEINDDPSHGFWGTKWIGEAEFKNIVVGAAPTPLNDVDKENGIQWTGFAEVDFISKSRSVLAKASGSVKSKDAFQRWISDPNPDQSLPEFSSFQNDAWFTELQLKNGQWQRQPHYSAKADVSMRGFELPTSILDYCDVKARACRSVPAEIK